MRAEGQPTTPLLCGLHLPPEVLERVYHANAMRLLAPPAMVSSG